MRSLTSPGLCVHDLQTFFAILLQVLVGASVLSMKTITTIIHSEVNMVSFGVPCGLFYPLLTLFHNCLF